MSSPNPHAIDADTLSGMKPLRKVVYSLGSNLGDRLGNLQGAVDALRDTPDIIVVGTSKSDQDDLKLPHPHAHERGFVLVPWREIDPTGELPGRGPVADLAAASDASGVVRRSDLIIEGD